MKIIITASSTTIEENREVLNSSKCAFIFFPTIEFKPVRKKPVSLKNYEWVIISSRKVYDFLSPLVKKQELQKIKIAAVGESSSRYLQEKNLKVNFISSIFTGAEFAREFVEKFPGIKGKVLRPVSTHAPREMEKVLRKLGIEVDTVSLYEPVPPSYTEDRIQKLKEESFQGIIFTSPSSWYNFKHIFGHDYSQLLKDKIIGAIGPTTAKVLEKDGYDKYLMPEKYTLANVIKKMEGEML
ncbi:MAG: uroporphyrinogen-III synthase [Candidatus Aminicenantales bacterium]